MLFNIDIIDKYASYHDNHDNVIAFVYTIIDSWLRCKLMKEGDY